MTYSKLISILLIAGTYLCPAMAQNVSSGADNDPISMIEAESEGNVEIDIPQNIIDLLLKEQEVKHKRENLRPGTNKMPGYRIQVFCDGNHQSSLESRARARGSAIVARFPKYRGQVYSYSSSPNWYTRIGNFRTSEEASTALAELKRAFPQYSNQMRVVKSQIIIVK